MKMWEIQRTEYKVSDFIDWKEHGLLDLNPKYQRRSVWDSKKKSYLIDTIIRGLPIPIIFIRQQEPDINSLKQIREVVDGQQRLRTLFSYIKPSLLKDYKESTDSFVVSRIHNKDLSGKEFSGIDEIYKKRILNYQFSVHVLPSDVDDKELLEIFSRLNSTGIKLNYQELRNASFFGVFKTSVYKQAITYLDRWKKWKIFNDQNIARMDEVELTSELFTLILNGIQAKTQGNLDKMYKDRDEEFAEVEEVEKRFQTVMDEIDEILGTSIKQTPFAKKTMFYILFAIIYDLLYGMKSILTPMRQNAISATNANTILLKAKEINDEAAPQKVLESSARRTTHAISRTILFKYFRDALSS